MNPVTVFFRTSILIFFLLANFCSANAQKITSNITVNSESLKDVKINIDLHHLERIPNDDVDPTFIEFKLTNSPFNTSFKVKRLAFVRVTVKGYDNTRPIFFMQPGDNIELDIELENGNIQYTVNGNELNNGLSNWNKNITTYYEARINSTYDQQRLDFVKRFPDTQFSTFLLVGDFGGFARFEPDTLIKYSNYLSDYALAGYHGQFINRQIREYSKVQKGTNLFDTKIDSLISLSRHKGKYIILDFWATWCRSCVLELPEINSANIKYKNMAHFISISGDEDRQKWERFIKRKKMNWEQILDITNIADEMGVHIFPTKFIIDQKGVVTHKYVGDHPDFFHELEAMMLENGNE